VANELSNAGLTINLSTVLPKQFRGEIKGILAGHKLLFEAAAAKVANNTQTEGYLRFSTDPGTAPASVADLVTNRFATGPSIAYQLISEVHLPVFYIGGIPCLFITGYVGLTGMSASSGLHAVTETLLYYGFYL